MIYLPILLIPLTSINLIDDRKSISIKSRFILQILTIILIHLKIRRLYILLEIFMVTLPQKKQDLPEDISDLGDLLGRNVQIYS